MKIKYTKRQSMVVANMVWKDLQGRKNYSRHIDAVRIAYHEVVTEGRHSAESFFAKWRNASANFHQVDDVIFSTGSGKLMLICRLIKSKNRKVTLKEVYGLLGPEEVHTSDAAFQCPKNCQCFRSSKAMKTCTNASPSTMGATSTGPFGQEWD